MLIRVVQRPRHRHHRTRRRRGRARHSGAGRWSRSQRWARSPALRRRARRTFMGRRGKTRDRLVRRSRVSSRPLLVVERAPRVKLETRADFTSLVRLETRDDDAYGTRAVCASSKGISRGDVLLRIPRACVLTAREALGEAHEWMGRGVELSGDASSCRVLTRGRARRKIEMGALRANAEWFRCRRVAPVALERRGRVDFQHRPA